MIGAMLSKIRQDMGFTKSEIARLIGVNTGHLTHIEKGERNPSLKTLKLICKVCKIPYQPLLYTYDKELSNSEIKSGIINNISYTKILAFDDINNFSHFIDCPAHKPSACIAIKITDDSMLNTFDLNTYAYVELNAPLESNDIGFFQYNEEFMIRKLVINKGSFSLKSDSPNYPDIKVRDLSKFYIIGKIIR